MTNLSGKKEKKWRPLSYSSLPIRSRLIRGSIAIMFLAVSIMGAFFYFQSSRTNTSLIDTFNATTRDDVENLLNSVADKQAESLSNHFVELKDGLSALQDYNQNLFSNRSSFENGLFWDAERSLSKNNIGSWDNPNSEVGSVFIPAKAELSAEMVSNLNVMRHMDLIAPSTLELNPDVIAVYFGGSTGYTLYYPNIDLAAIVPADFDVTGRPWYVKASSDLNPEKGVVWSDPYLDAALNGIVITNSAPVYDKAGEFQGVVAQDIQLTKISETVTNIRVGETGYAFLIDQEKRLIAMPEAGYKNLGIDPIQSPLGNELTDGELSELGSEFISAIQNMVTGNAGLSTINVNGNDYFFVYRPVQDVNFSLAIMAPEQELLAEATAIREDLERDNRNAVIISFLVILGLISITVVITTNFSSNMTEPLVSLTNTAEEMAKGNLNARANVTDQNEFGTLAATLNTMASSLKESIETLEIRVADRTAEAQERSRELEIANKQIQRRATQFEALAQVAQSISAVRDPLFLLPRVSALISEHYGFYHVGVFLIDEAGEYAVLTATNSEGGRKLLERHHRLKVGEQGIVGSVAGTGEPRIALDVGADAVFFNNPELPATHSEMALPLRSEGKVIGVLDIQSIESGAFTQEDVQTLSLLADQVSLAIENARLFENSTRTLNDLQMVMRQATRDAWKRLPEQQKMIGFRYNAMGASPLKEPIDLAIKDKGIVSTSIVVPIELRGEVIGNLVVQSPAGNEWNEDQQDLIRAVAERVALSAENARLFDETTQRAERERLVSEITGKIRSHNDPQAMIETAMQELRNALGASRVEIIPKSTGNKDKE